MAKINVEIEVPSGKHCDTLDNACPMLQKGYWGRWHCCLFDVDLKTDSYNHYYPCIRCNKCKQAEIEE